MKKVIFVVLLLAVASLGLALPSKTKTPNLPNLPKVKSPASTVLPSSSASFSPSLPSSSPSLPLTADTLSSPQALADDLKVSQNCAKALVTLFTSPDFLKCIPLNAVIPVIPVVTDPNFLKSLVADPAGTFKKDEQVFVTFSTQFCPTPKCSDKSVQGAIKLISDGCADDLKTNQIVQLIFGITVFYSPLHDSVCFKSNDHKLFCWDESLQTVFSLPKSPLKVTGNPLLDSIAVADCKAVCTDCNKSVINTFFNFLKNNDLALQILKGLGVDQKVIDGLTLGVAVKCGINFEDGKIPNKT